MHGGNIEIAACIALMAVVAADWLRKTWAEIVEAESRIQITRQINQGE